MTKSPKPNQTNTQEVRKQNQQSAQKQQGMNTWEEFGAETDVEQVKKQNQQSEMKKSKNATKQFGKGFK